MLARGWKLTVAWDRRTLLGLASTLVVLGLLTVAESFAVRIDARFYELAIRAKYLDGAIVMFVAVLIGALVARGRFLVPGISLSLAVWLTMMFVASGKSNFFEIALLNLDFLLAYITAAILGAAIGAWYVGRRARHDASAS
jgi:hypothetical protein